VSLWRRLFGQKPPEPVTEPDAGVTPASPEPAEPAPANELAPLEALAAGETPALERLLSALRACQGTARERAALEAITAAKRRASPPEPLLVAAADLASQRGDADLALELLDGASDGAALVLAADIRAERGELALALTAMERVLARDIDAPGARERHERWRQRLGGGRAPALPLDAPTVLRAEAPETSLRIVGEAGRGGAATVYEAIDEVLGRKVALKVYHRPAEDRDKLEREARSAVQMAGSGVVRIFDADPARGFIVMEWAAGGALKRWISRADLAMLWPIERWLLPLVRALARVHALGFVHGDLKPANVLFRAAADPVLSDFGLAHPTGSVIDGGSFGYLSPERLIGQAVTAADDVYGLGRIVEDVLAALGRLPEGERPDPLELEAWRRRAARALGPIEARPRAVSALLGDGTELLGSEP
jgi:serine/threonine-protein kinase